METIITYHIILTGTLTLQKLLDGGGYWYSTNTPFLFLHVDTCFFGYIIQPSSELNLQEKV